MPQEDAIKLTEIEANNHRLYLEYVKSKRTPEDRKRILAQTKYKNWQIFRHKVSEIRCKYPSLNLPVVQGYAKRVADVVPTTPIEREQIEDIIHEKVPLEKERQKVSELQAELGKIIRTMAYEERLIDLLREIVPRFDYKSPPLSGLIPRESEDEEDAILIISDSQLGMLIRAQEMGGMNFYSKEQFLIEFDMFEKGLWALMKLESKIKKFGKLWIIYLGDMVEGHDIFSGQPYNLDLNAAEACVFGANRFSQFEIKCTSLPFKKIETIEITGNHGTPGGRKAGAVPITLNFDWLFYNLKHYMTENYTLKQEDRTQVPITHFVSRTWFQLFAVQQWLCLAIHGDEIRSYMSTPYYGIDRAFSAYLQLMDKVFHYMFLAHHHAGATLPAGRGEKIINGAWCGPGNLTKKIRQAAMPMQWLLWIHPRKGITSRYPVYLTDRMAPNYEVPVYCGSQTFRHNNIEKSTEEYYRELETQA